MNIKRIEGYATHRDCWQAATLRGPDGKYPPGSKTFADDDYGGKLEAYAAAAAYALQYDLEHPDEATHRLARRPTARNTSGLLGVCRMLDNGWPTWKAIFRASGPYPKKKGFSVNKYGEDEARRLALTFRVFWEDFYKKGKEAEFWAMVQDENGRMKLPDSWTRIG